MDVNKRAAKKLQIKKSKKKLIVLEKKIKDTIKKREGLKKQLSEAKLKKDKATMIILNKKIEKADDAVKIVDQQKLVSKMNLNKAMGKKIRISKKKVEGTKKILGKTSIRLAVFEMKEKKFMDEKKDLLALKTPLDKKQIKHLADITKQLSTLKKNIPKAQDDLAALNEKYNVLRGKEITSPDVFKIEKKMRKEKRRIIVAELKIIEARKAWDEAEVDFTRNKTKPQKAGIKGKMIIMRKKFMMLREKLEIDNKKLVE